LGSLITYMHPVLLLIIQYDGTTENQYSTLPTVQYHIDTCPFHYFCIYSLNAWFGSFKVKLDHSAQKGSKMEYLHSAFNMKLLHVNSPGVRISLMQ